MTAPAGHLQVTLDAGRCAASGSCARVAPTVFRLADGALTVLDASPPATLRGDVEVAAAICPTAAITVEN